MIIFPSAIGAHVVKMTSTQEKAFCGIRFEKNSVTVCSGSFVNITGWIYQN
jgi:hypothetical protein